MDGLMRDLRSGLRVWRRDRGSALVAILSLAVGVGANVAVFSVLRALLIAEMQYPEASRIVVLSKVVPGMREQPLASAELEAVRQAPAYREAAGCASVATVARGTSNAEEGVVTKVTSSFFRLFAVEPLLGRALGESEIQSAAPVCVLSYDLWVSQYGGSPGVVGQELHLNRKIWTVIGVMPAGFAPPCGAPAKRVVWVPYSRVQETGSAGQNGSDALSVFVRLPRGVSLQSARREMQRLVALPGQAATGVGNEIAVEQLSARDSASVKSGLLLSQTVALLLLFVACANVANLLLARGSTRTAEIGTRLALGAQRSRVVRQLIAEGTLMASIGGLAGVALAFAMVKVLVGLAPIPSPRQVSIAVRTPELLVGLAAGWLTWILAAIGPAVVASRVDPLTSLRGDLLSLRKPALSLLRSVFVASQLLLTVVVVTVAGLLAKSFVQVLGQPLGFEPHGLVVAEVSAPMGLGNGDFYRQLTRRLDQAVRIHFSPTTSIAIASDMPYTSTRSTARWTLLTPAGTDYQADCSSAAVSVSPEYFRVLGVPVVRGRDFQNAKGDVSAALALVNEQFVRVYGRNRDLVGYRLVRRQGDPLTIIGVVGDTRSFRVTSPPMPTVYLPFHSTPTNRLSVAVRGMTVPEVSAIVGAAVRSVDPDIPVRAVVPVQAEAWRREHTRTFYALLMSVFGALACVLAAAGVFGVVAHAVSSKRFELGLRLALGARPRQLVTSVLLRALVPGGIGLAGGALAASALTTLLVKNAVFVDQLYNTRPGDIVVLSTALGGLLGVTAVACWIPLRRALRTDPLVVLKAE